MQIRDYSFLGTTQSLCPECLELIPAKIIVRRGRVYFRKHCPRHGQRDDFVCSDINFYDRLEYTLPAKSPVEYGVQPDRGCPFDCGLCTEHEQHTCIGLVELTSSCNLTCPMCYASSAPGGTHVPLDECRRAIDRLVEVEGQPEVLQLSGGEPTIHPQFMDVVEYALSQPIDYVQINTNGIRFAHDPQLVESLARHRRRLEIFFQLDGLNDQVSRSLRGEPLLELKLRTLENLRQADLHVTLAVTLQAGVNEDQLGPLVRFALQRPWITGINFQPATYTGRHYLPEQLDNRITFPDVIKGIARQTDGLLREDDFMPLPCAHPNCHSIAILWRTGDSVVPLNRFIDARKNFDLLANGIGFTRPHARNLILQYLGRQGCCQGGCTPDDVTQAGGLPVLDTSSQECRTPPPKSDEFFANVLAEQLGAKDLFRITITSFLDAYTFDVRRLMKCCTHHVLPSGHVIPFCAYNTLYRPGHVPLPVLTRAASDHAPR